MKSITIIFFIALGIISCKSVEIIPTDIIGKWSPSFRIDYDYSTNTWKKEQPFDSIRKASVVEFTNNNKFLINNSPGGSICYAGDKFRVDGNKLIFSEFSLRGIGGVYCQNCKEWTIEKLDKQTLILEECGVYKIKYVKTN